MNFVSFSESENIQILLKWCGGRYSLALYLKAKQKSSHSHRETEYETIKIDLISEYELQPVSHRDNKGEREEKNQRKNRVQLISNLIFCFQLDSNWIRVHRCE